VPIKTITRLELANIRVKYIEHLKRANWMDGINHGLNWLKILKIDKIPPTTIIVAPVIPYKNARCKTNIIPQLKVIHIKFR
jgi:hypothetical protein